MRPRSIRLTPFSVPTHRTPPRSTRSAVMVLLDRPLAFVRRSKRPSRRWFSPAEVPIHMPPRGSSANATTRLCASPVSVVYRLIEPSAAIVVSPLGEPSHTVRCVSSNAGPMTDGAPSGSPYGITSPSLKRINPPPLVPTQRLCSRSSTIEYGELFGMSLVGPSVVSYTHLTLPTSDLV